VYTFIAEEQANKTSDWTVTEMCRVLDVSRSGCYDWVNRQPSQREISDRQLAFEIETIWECSGRTYGVPRMHAWLHQQGFNPSRKRVARLMRRLGIEGESGRAKVRTTIVDRAATAPADRLARDFNPGAPDVAWCGDITYLRTGEGWLFLATVIDLFSRRVIGWSIATHMRTELVADALRMAVAARGGSVAGVLFHSDKGCQYTSSEYAELCAAHGIERSTGATGVCWDNAVAEAFFATLKREMYYRQSWPTRTEARRAVIRWIETWFNPRRLHTTNGFRSPAQKEADWYNQHRNAA
jgi:transposase InsO family protein